MPIINHQTIPEMLMRPGIRGQFLAHKNLGAEGVSLLVNTVEPGAAAPLHKHTVEETMLVLEGTVWVRVGEECWQIGPRDIVAVPGWAWHSVEADEELVVFSFSDEVLQRHLGFWREERGGSRKVLK